jgi:hypothetical protein
MTSSLKIYVLQLENDKWFLYLSPDDLSYDVLTMECKTLFEFIRQNKPLSLFETINASDYYDVNTWTKRYMSFCGINNVRGGIYIEEQLPEYIVKSIELELSTSVYEDYINRTYMFANLREKTNLRLIDFQNEYDKYQELLKMGYGKITRSFFDELLWLSNFIENSQDNMDMVTEEEKNRYKKLLSTMEYLHKLYFNLEDEKISLVNDIFLTKPAVVLERFVFQTGNIINREHELNDALSVINKYEFMGYILINIIDCMEFDFNNPSTIKIL